MQIPVPGAELFCASRGDGPVCLVLTGIGTAPYERQMPPQLSDQLKLVFVELRGSGRSTGQATDLTFDLLAEDLEAVRRALGVARVAVLGHSILGILAIEYGRRRPDAVSHVIAVGTPPFGDMEALVRKATAFFEQDASDERKRLLRQNLAALPPNAPPGQFVFAQTPMRFFDPRTEARPLFAGADSKPQFLAHVMGTLARDWDVTVDPASLRVPILLAHGRHDYVVPYVLWDGIPATLPHAKLRLFEHSGHQPFYEEPDEFTTAVTAWMGVHR